MADDQLTTEELYGKSDPPASPPMPLTYEETPVIEPPIQPGPMVPKSGRFGHTIATIVFFILLFAFGIWLSTFLRQYTQTSLPASNAPTPTQSALPLVSPTVTPPLSGWKTYTVAGASYQLPQDMLAPICDGASCVSEGTYLPGGTRFTVATHNNARQFTIGAVIVDAGGREFTTTETTVAGRRAFAYDGQFSGTTTGGYRFSQMRGVMIILDDTQTLELNHFTPTGVSADFVSDEAVFDEILKTLTLASAQQ